MLDLILSKREESIRVAKRILGDKFDDFISDNIAEIACKGFVGHSLGLMYRVITYFSLVVSYYEGREGLLFELRLHCKSENGILSLEKKDKVTLDKVKDAIRDLLIKAFEII